MTFHVTSRWGDVDDTPSVDRMREILAELGADDAEHPDCWLAHENGWVVSAHQDGRVVFESPDEDVPPRHLRDVARDRVLELWMFLAAGDVAVLEKQPWQVGNGNAPLTDAERADLAAALLAKDRTFYDSLGAEREDAQCSEAACSRGAVAASAFCRMHHFANVTHRPCTFSD
ncbi:MAG TPA: hypothetical protein VGM90_32195 [Kofleriaceae bacterium]|jgi:hypothetical protein